MADRLPLTYRGKVVGSAQVNEDGTIDGDIDMSLLTEIEKMDLCWSGWSTHLSVDASRQE